MISSASPTPRDRLIVALDTSDRNEARSLVRALRGRAGLFKVGLQLFSACGPDVVREIVEGGDRVFLDLKLHDIPNTAARAVAEAVRMGAAFADLHASGGEAMLRAAVAEAGRQGPAAMKLFGVTLLTSLDAAAARAIGFSGDVPAVVAGLAGLAQRCGLDGVVVSPHEAAAVKRAFGPSFLTIVPGIRPEGADPGDQKRAATPRQAAASGADYIVVGRPITAAADPAAAADAIVADLGR